MKDTLRYCMLGLMKNGPKTGYDIKRIFDSYLSYFWNASDSQIYATLRQLEKENLVYSKMIFQEQRPNRKLYHLTERGEQEFNEWLLMPVPERFTKDDFLTKFFFSGEGGPKVALDLLRAHHEELERQLAYINSQYDKYIDYQGTQKERVRYRLIALRYKRAMLNAANQVVREEIEKLTAEVNRFAGSQATR